MTPRFVVYLIVVAFAAVLAIVRLRSMTKELKVLGVLCWLVLILEICGRILVVEFGNSSPVYHILIPALLLLFHRMYMWLVPADVFSIRFRKGIIILLIVTFIANSVKNQTVWVFPSQNLAALSLFVVLLSLIGFLKMVTHVKDIEAWRLPEFWINTGNIVFYCTTFSIFSILNPLISGGGIPPEWEFSVIWVSNVLLYSCYIVAFVIQIQSYKEV